MTRAIALSATIFLLVASPVVGEDSAAKETPPATETARETTKNAPPDAPPEEKQTNAPPKKDRPTALEFMLVLKVANPSVARKSIQTEAEKLGGFLSFVNGHRIVVKLPPDKLLEMVKQTEGLGLVLEKRFSRTDLTMEIAELGAQLKSKQEILGKTRGFFDDSDVIATLAIEKTMTGLVEEMEEIKGRLRVLRDRAAWAVLEIPFRFRERDRIKYVRSDFDWLNTVDLDRFLEEFDHDE